MDEKDRRYEEIQVGSYENSLEDTKYSIGNIVNIIVKVCIVSSGY